MLVAVKSIIKYFHLAPENIPSSDTARYNAAIQAHVKDLLNNYNFMHSHETDGLFMGPAVFQGVINFVYFPEKGDAFGDVFLSNIQLTGMPLWIIANFGATVRPSSYFLFDIHSLYIISVHIISM
jgi:hypothetical protein